METFSRKQTSWEGLWYHKEYCGFSSAAIDLSTLKQFKGPVRLYVRKNKYYNDGLNNRPNYFFCIKAFDSETFKTIEVSEDEDNAPYYDKEDECYYDEEGGRLYTSEEVRRIINGTFDDVKYGISDPYDILPSDFV